MSGLAGYRKRTCPKCLKTSYWHNGSFCDPAGWESKLLDLAGRLSDKNKVIALLHEMVVQEISSTFNSEFIRQMLADNGLTPERMIEEIKSTLPKVTP